MIDEKKRKDFLSATHLEEQAAARLRQAEQLPQGEARQHALKNAAQLQSYAEMKRKLLPNRPSVSGENVEARG